MIVVKVVIVDDEPDACDILYRLLTKYIDGISVVAIAHDVDSGMEMIRKYHPDLVFLDIEMPNGNGFTLLEKFPVVDFDVIFATAYDQYAIKAIKFSALDYLLKPFDLGEIKNAVSKYLNKRQQKFDNNRIELLLDNIKSGTRDYKKIAIPTNDGYTFVNTYDIIRCMADGSYTEIFLCNGRKIVSSRKLKEYEDVLPVANFFRIHRSSIVNLNFINRFSKNDGYQVFMDDGVVLDVSFRRKDEFLDRVKKR